MDKKTVSPNAYMLLALLISKGLVTLSNINESKITDTATKTKNERIADKVKKLVDNKTTTKTTRREIQSVLSNIDARYPELKEFESDSQEAKNLTAIAGINAPTSISIPATTPVQLPQEIVTGMQNEIFTRRQQTAELNEALNTKERASAIQKGKTKAAKERLADEKAIGVARESLIDELNNDLEALQLELEIKRKEADEYKRNTQQLEEQVNVLLREGKTEAKKALEKEIERRLKQSKKQAVEYKKIEAQQKKIEQKITESSQQTQQVVRDSAEQTQTVILSRIDRMRNEIKGMGLSNTLTRNVERQPIIPEQRGVSGLGLTDTQRKQLRQIITRETNSEYAGIVDMIAGNELETTRPADIMRALTGLAISVAVPIPRPILNNLINIAGRAVGFDEWFNNIFVEHKTSDDDVVLTQNNKVTSLNVIQNQMPTQLKESEKEKEGKHDKPPPAIAAPDQNLKQQRRQQLKDSKGRYVKKTSIPAIGQVLTDMRDNGPVVNTQLGGALGGAAAYAITGSVASAVTGASIGGLVGALSPAISRIGEALAEQLPDTIPTTTGIQREVKRQVKFTTPEIGYKTEEETIAELTKKMSQLAVELKSTTDPNKRETITNQMDYFTAYIDMIRENGLSPYDQKRRTIRGELRPTTDEEKALVPFNEAEERTTYDKKKALAVAGAVGSAVVAAGVERSGMFKERPIEVPSIVYGQQQGKEFDTTMPNMARGLLRPKFIMPDADILQPSNQELAADALEFAMFDFVEPSSEGAEGTNQTNILKAFQKENENIRYRGAGVVVNSLFGNDANDLTTQQITKMFLWPTIPPMVFTEIQQNLSEYEVNQYDVNNEITGIEFFSPYNNFTNVNPGLGENMSMLFDVVP
jgi:hypothetical protein